MNLDMQVEHMIGTQSDRVSIITNYCKQEHVKIQPELEICHKATTTLVMPVFNEANFIEETLGNFAENCTGEVEVVAVDNGSMDGTPDIIRAIARQSPLSINLLSFTAEKGPGPARRAGADQVLAHYLASCPQADKKHWITIIDADALLDPLWLTNHKKITAEDPSLSVMGVVYRFPQRIDDAIADAAKIQNYFYSLSLLARDLTMRGIAKIQTGTKGSAIEVSAYARVGGAPKTGKDESGRTSEDRLMGEHARRLGEKIGFNPALNIHNPRRVLHEMSSNIPALSSYDAGDPSQSVYREPEEVMLEKALKRVGKDALLASHRTRLESFIQRNIVLPVIHGQLNRDPLFQFLNENNTRVDSIENSTKIIAKLLINTNPMLTAIYQ